MKIKRQTLILLLLLQPIFNTSCDKDEVIELNANYLTVTDVIKYCSRDCSQDTDLKGKEIKTKGHLKVNSQGQFLFEWSYGIVFIINDIRNSNAITIKVLNDTMNIKQKLGSLIKEMIYINGRINYGYIPSSNSGCSNSLFIEIDSASEILSFN